MPPVNKHPFDQAFAEGLHRLRAQPEPEAWQQIYARVHRRRRLPLWYWLAILFGTAGLIYGLTSWWQPEASKMSASAPIASVVAATDAPVSAIPSVAAPSVLAGSLTTLCGQKADPTSSPTTDAAKSTLHRSDAHSSEVYGLSAKPETTLSKPDAPTKAKALSKQASMAVQARSVNGPVLASREDTDSQPQSPETENLLPDASNAELPSAEPVGDMIAADAALSYLRYLPLAGLERDVPRMVSPELPCPTFKDRATWSLALRGLAGSDHTTRDFSNTSTILQPYRMLRDSVEQLQNSVHAGLRLEAVNSKGLFVRAGLDHQMYRSRVTQLGQVETRTTTIDIREFPGGPVIRTDTMIERGRRQSVTYNRHQTLALVAGLGYRPSFGIWSPYIMAEAGYEWRMYSRGMLLRPNGEQAVLPEPGAEWIAPRPGLQYGAVLGVDVALTLHWELGLSAHGKQLGSLRGEGDVLTYDQRSLFGALNLRYSL